MKYQLVADNPIEQQALESGLVPLPVLDTLLPVVQVRAIMAGVHLGIFEALGKGSATADEVARSLSLDAECVGLLLRVLVCAGYVTREADEYRLTELSQHTLLADSRRTLSGVVEWSYFEWNWIENLEEVVKTGAGVDAHANLGPPENWATYQKAMLQMARTMARDVASLVPIKQQAQRMLDIGGSHGLYGAMMCRLHPPMRSEVFDLPEAVEHARALAREEGIDDVVSHRSGNALRDDLGLRSLQSRERRISSQRYGGDLGFRTPWPGRRSGVGRGRAGTILPNYLDGSMLHVRRLRRLARVSRLR
jgi:hypothetical protein